MIDHRLALNLKYHPLFRAKAWERLWCIFKYIYVYRFDLCTFNHDELENYYTNIYSDELELKKKNKDPCRASFLDLSIEVSDRKIAANLFGKRNAFPFILYINIIY